MSLFFDTKVQFVDNDTVSTIVVFHPFESIFAVAGYGDNRGGTVTIFDESVRMELNLTNYLEDYGSVGYLCILLVGSCLFC